MDLQIMHLRRIGRPVASGLTARFICFRHPVTLIGRDPFQCDYVICSADISQAVIISRLHARVLKNENNKHKLCDDSKNGIFVNYVKISESVVLSEGDLVTFGHQSGENLAPGTKARQPGSEYTYIFEPCTCNASTVNRVQPCSQDVKNVNPSTSIDNTTRVSNVLPPKKKSDSVNNASVQQPELNAVRLQHRDLIYQRVSSEPASERECSEQPPCNQRPGEPPNSEQCEQEDSIKNGKLEGAIFEQKTDVCVESELVTGSSGFDYCGTKKTQHSVHDCVDPISMSHAHMNLDQCISVDSDMIVKDQEEQVSQDRLSSGMKDPVEVAPANVTNSDIMEQDNAVDEGKQIPSGCTEHAVEHAVEGVVDQIDQDIVVAHTSSGPTKQIEVEVAENQLEANLNNVLLDCVDQPTPTERHRVELVGNKAESIICWSAQELPMTSQQHEHMLLDEADRDDMKQVAEEVTVHACPSLMEPIEIVQSIAHQLGQPADKSGSVREAIQDLLQGVVSEIGDVIVHEHRETVGNVRKGMKRHATPAGNEEAASDIATKVMHIDVKVHEDVVYGEEDQKMLVSKGKLKESVTEFSSQHVPMAGVTVVQAGTTSAAIEEGVSDDATRSQTDVECVVHIEIDPSYKDLREQVVKNQSEEAVKEIGNPCIPEESKCASYLEDIEKEIITHSISAEINGEISDKVAQCEQGEVIFSKEGGMEQACEHQHSEHCVEKAVASDHMVAVEHAADLLERLSDAANEADQLIIEQRRRAATPDLTENVSSHQEMQVSSGNSAQLVKMETALREGFECTEENQTKPIFDSVCEDVLDIVKQTIGQYKEPADEENTVDRNTQTMPAPPCEDDNARSVMQVMNTDTPEILESGNVQKGRNNLENQLVHGEEEAVKQHGTDEQEPAEGGIAVEETLQTTSVSNEDVDSDSAMQSLPSGVQDVCEKVESAEESSPQQCSDEDGFDKSEQAGTDTVDLLVIDREKLADALDPIVAESSAHSVRISAEESGSTRNEQFTEIFAEVLQDGTNFPKDDHTVSILENQADTDPSEQFVKELVDQPEVVQKEQVGDDTNGPPDEKGSLDYAAQVEPLATENLTFRKMESVLVEVTHQGVNEEVKGNLEEAVVAVMVVESRETSNVIAAEVAGQKIQTENEEPHVGAVPQVESDRGDKPEHDVEDPLEVVEMESEQLDFTKASLQNSQIELALAPSPVALQFEPTMHVHSERASGIAVTSLELAEKEEPSDANVGREGLDAQTQLGLDTAIQARSVTDIELAHVEQPVTTIQSEQEILVIQTEYNVQASPQKSSEQLQCCLQVDLPQETEKPTVVSDGKNLENLHMQIQNNDTDDQIFGLQRDRVDSGRHLERVHESDVSMQMQCSLDTCCNALLKTDDVETEGSGSMQLPVNSEMAEFVELKQIMLETDCRISSDIPSGLEGHSSLDEKVDDASIPPDTEALSYHVSGLQQANDAILPRDEAAPDVVDEQAMMSLSDSFAKRFETDVVDSVCGSNSGTEGAPLNVTSPHVTSCQDADRNMLTIYTAADEECSQRETKSSSNVENTDVVAAVPVEGVPAHICTLEVSGISVSGQMQSQEEAGPVMISDDRRDEIELETQPGERTANSFECLPPMFERTSAAEEEVRMSAVEISNESSMEKLALQASMKSQDDEPELQSVDRETAEPVVTSLCTLGVEGVGPATETQSGDDNVEHEIEETMTYVAGDDSVDTENEEKCASNHQNTEGDMAEYDPQCNAGLVTTNDGCADDEKKAGEDASADSERTILDETRAVLLENLDNQVEDKNSEVEGSTMQAETTHDVCAQVDSMRTTLNESCIYAESQLSENCEHDDQFSSAVRQNVVLDMPELPVTLPVEMSDEKCGPDGQAEEFSEQLSCGAIQVNKSDKDGVEKSVGATSEQFERSDENENDIKKTSLGTSLIGIRNSMPSASLLPASERAVVLTCYPDDKTVSNVEKCHDSWISEPGAIYVGRSSQQSVGLPSTSAESLLRNAKPWQNPVSASKLDSQCNRVTNILQPQACPSEDGQFDDADSEEENLLVNPNARKQYSSPVVGIAAERVISPPLLPYSRMNQAVSSGYCTIESRKRKLSPHSEDHCLKRSNLGVPHNIRDELCTSEPTVVTAASLKVNGSPDDVLTTAESIESSMSNKEQPGDQIANHSLFETDESSAKREPMSSEQPGHQTSVEFTDSGSPTQSISADIGSAANGPLVHVYSDLDGQSRCSQTVDESTDFDSPSTPVVSDSNVQSSCSPLVSETCIEACGDKMEPVTQNVLLPTCDADRLHEPAMDFLNNEPLQPAIAEEVKPEHAEVQSESDASENLLDVGVNAECHSECVKSCKELSASKNNPLDDQLSSNGSQDLFSQLSVGISCLHSNADLANSDSLSQQSNTHRDGLSLESPLQLELSASQEETEKTISPVTCNKESLHVDAGDNLHLYLELSQNPSILQSSPIETCRAHESDGFDHKSTENPCQAIDLQLSGSPVLAPDDLQTKLDDTDAFASFLQSESNVGTLKRRTSVCSTASEELDIHSQSTEVLSFISLQNDCDGDKTAAFDASLRDSRRLSESHHGVSSRRTSVCSISSQDLDTLSQTTTGCSLVSSQNDDGINSDQCATVTCKREESDGEQPTLTGDFEADDNTLNDRHVERTIDIAGAQQLTPATVELDEAHENRENVDCRAKCFEIAKENVASVVAFERTNPNCGADDEENTTNESSDASHGLTESNYADSSEFILQSEQDVVSSVKISSSDKEIENSLLVPHNSSQGYPEVLPSVTCDEESNQMLFDTVEDAAENETRVVLSMPASFQPNNSPDFVGLCSNSVTAAIDTVTSDHDYVSSEDTGRSTSFKPTNSQGIVSLCNNCDTATVSSISSDHDYLSLQGMCPFTSNEGTANDCHDVDDHCTGDVSSDAFNGDTESMHRNAYDSGVQYAKDASVGIETYPEEAALVYSAISFNLKTVMTDGCDCDAIGSPPEAACVETDTEEEEEEEEAPELSGTSYNLVTVMAVGSCDSDAIESQQDAACVETDTEKEEEEAPELSGTSYNLVTVMADGSCDSDAIESQQDAACVETDTEKEEEEAPELSGTSCNLVTVMAVGSCDSDAIESQQDAACVETDTEKEEEEAPELSGTSCNLVTVMAVGSCDSDAIESQQDAACVETDTATLCDVLTSASDNGFIDSQKESVCVELEKFETSDVTTEAVLESSNLVRSSSPEFDAEIESDDEYNGNNDDEICADSEKNCHSSGSEGEEDLPANAQPPLDCREDEVVCASENSSEAADESYTGGVEHLHAIYSAVGAQLLAANESIIHPTGDSKVASCAIPVVELLSTKEMNVAQATNAGDKSTTASYELCGNSEALFDDNDEYEFSPPSVDFCLTGSPVQCTAVQCCETETDSSSSDSDRHTANNSSNRLSRKRLRKTKDRSDAKLKRSSGNVDMIPLNAVNASLNGDQVCGSSGSCSNASNSQLNTSAVTVESQYASQEATESQDFSQVTSNRQRSEKVKSLLMKLKAKREVKQEVDDNDVDDDVSVGQSMSVCSSYGNCNQSTSACNDVDLINKQELDTIESGAKLPSTVVAVVGDTGSGKSSLLNAMLDEAGLLPTSGIRACTAVVVRISENTSSDQYEAEIEFLDEREWMSELKLLLRELTSRKTGLVRTSPPDPDSEAIVAWSKIRAVYGPFSKHVTLEQLARQRTVTRWLSRKQTIKLSSISEFKKTIHRYIESHDLGSGGEYWPIVKHVSIRLPNSRVCRGGIVLVDLPGIGDSNAARDRIAKDYLKNCSAVWVVSSIHRAVNDKTARDLLGEHFRRQLLMDGQYGSVSFVCTKTDSLSPSEIISNLKLEADSEDIRAEIASHEMSLEEERSNGAKHHQNIVRLRRKLDRLRNDEMSLNTDVVELTQVIQEEDYPEDDEVRCTLSQMKVTLTETEQKKRLLQEQLDQETSLKASSDEQTNRLLVRLESRRKALMEFCSLARNKFAAHQIRRDFEAGMKQMRRQVNTRFDEDDYDENEIDETELHEVRRLTENFKVFCCSSTEFLKLRGKLRNDGPPQVFNDVKDTGIPALVEHVHAVSEVRRRFEVNKMVRNFGCFVASVAGYLIDSGNKDRNRSLSSKPIFKQHLSQLEDKTLAEVLATTMANVGELFSNSLQPKVYDGAKQAASSAIATVTRWGSKVNKDKSCVSGLPWSTYKAVVLRQGCYKSPSFGLIDFNADLSGPMYSSLSIVWDQIFNVRLCAFIDGFKDKVLKSLRSFSVKLHIDLKKLAFPNECLTRVAQQQMANATNRLLHQIDQLKTLIMTRQRDINRVVTPAVQDNMLPAYNACAAESGSGMFERMKNHMNSHVETARRYMFDSASEQLITQLVVLENDISSALEDLCSVIIADTKALYEPLFDSAASSTTSLLRTQLIKDMLQHREEICSLYVLADLQEHVDELDGLNCLLSACPVMETDTSGSSYSAERGKPSIKQGLTDATVTSLPSVRVSGASEPSVNVENCAGTYLSRGATGLVHVADQRIMDIKPTLPSSLGGHLTAARQATNVLQPLHLANKPSTFSQSPGKRISLVSLAAVNAVAAATSGNSRACPDRPVRIKDEPVSPTNPKRRKFEFDVIDLTDDD